MKVNIAKYRKTKCHKRQVKIHIDDFDTWSLDHTLSMIILPALLQLKEQQQGIPGEFTMVGGGDDTDQHSFDFYQESYDWAFTEGCKKWDRVLDKMIWAFQEIVHGDYDMKYHHGDAKYDWVKTDETFANPLTGKTEATYRMVDLNPGEHWYDHTGHLLHEERIQEGLDLFGKYFRHLWT